MEAHELLNVVPLIVAMVVLPLGRTTPTARGQGRGRDDRELSVTPYFRLAGTEGDVMAALRRSLPA